MLWENFLCMCSVQCTVLMMRFASCLLSRAEMSTIWSMHWVHYCILFVHFRDILRTTVTTAECPQLFNFIATFNNWINGWFETQYCSLGDADVRWLSRVTCWPSCVTRHVTLPGLATQHLSPLSCPTVPLPVTSDRLHLFLLHISNSVYPEYLIHILIIWSLSEAIPKPAW